MSKKKSHFKPTEKKFSIFLHSSIEELLHNSKLFSKTKLINFACNLSFYSILLSCIHFTKHLFILNVKY